MVGRPRQFDEHQALEAAMDVFWKHGFEAASIEQLLEAMGLNAGSLYATFGDKRTLFEKAFQNYVSTVYTSASATLNGAGSPLENVRALVKRWSEIVSEPDCKGCLVSQTVVEFSGVDDPLGAWACEILVDIQKQFEENLSKAKRLGELTNSADPADLAAMLVTTAQGLNVMVRSGASQKSLQGVIRTTLSLLH